jgi:L-fucose mutarotase
MLTIKLTHPAILNALGSMGHGSKVLIADGHFPFSTHTNQNAKYVFLNLSRGIPTVTQVLEALVSVIPVEAAQVMVPDTGPEPSIFSEFRQLLPGMELQPTKRFAFYDLARTQDVGLVIATGEVRIYANLMLTIGVAQ